MWSTWTIKVTNDSGTSQPSSTTALPLADIHRQGWGHRTKTRKIRRLTVQTPNPWSSLTSTDSLPALPPLCPVPTTTPNPTWSQAFVSPFCFQICWSFELFIQPTNFARDWFGTKACVSNQLLLPVEHPEIDDSTLKWTSWHNNKLNIILSIMAVCCLAVSYSCWESLMLKVFTLNVIVLSVVSPQSSYYIQRQQTCADRYCIY